MNTIDQIAMKIIKEQELIIGPIAWHEAKKVNGLKIINQKTGDVAVEGDDGKIVIDRLIGQYERLFGRASGEVCKDAVSSLLADISSDDVPLSLR